MKKILLASSALFIAGSAQAADMPVRMATKAPVVAAIPYSWTGCYIGAHGGYGWGNKDFSDSSGIFFSGLGQFERDRVTGGLAGGQIGCNYQFASNFVIGIEGDAAWADIKGTALDPFFGGKSTLNAKTDALYSATGRIGYNWDRVLFYGKGGAAWAHDSYNILTQSIGGPATFLGSETRVGWTAGAGIEWAFYNNWSAKFEYNHYDFGTRTLNLTIVGGGGGFLPADIRQRIDTVTVGINYRFWSAGPVVARY